MLRLFLYLILAGVVMLFASQNMDDVRVYVIAGRPVDAPLIVVIGISFFAGFASAIFGVIRNAVKSKQRSGASVADQRRGH